MEVHPAPQGCVQYDPVPWPYPSTETASLFRTVRLEPPPYREPSSFSALALFLPYSHLTCSFTHPQKSRPLLSTIHAQEQVTSFNSNSPVPVTVVWLPVPCYPTPSADNCGSARAGDFLCYLCILTHSTCLEPVCSWKTFAE